MGKMVVPGGESVYIDCLNGSRGRLSCRLDDVVWGFFGDSNPGWTNEAEKGAVWHSDWIEYLTLDGTKWFSKAVSHSTPFTNQPSITFQHWPDGTDMSDPPDPDHEDDNIKFLGWNGEHWALSAWTEPAKTDGKTRNQVKFRVWGV